MHLHPRLKAAGLVAVGIALGGVGLAAADVPDSATGEISACVNTTNQAARIIDAEAGATCKSSESVVTWNQTGPQGPEGPQGPAGPTLVSSGWVEPDGTVKLEAAAGPVPSVERIGPGHYHLVLTGLGDRCLVPQIDAVASHAAITFNGGHCAGGIIDTFVFVEGDQDVFWSYLIIGYENPASAARSAGGAEVPLPQMD